MDNFTCNYFLLYSALCCQMLAISTNQQMADINKDPDHVGRIDTCIKQIETCTGPAFVSRYSISRQIHIMTLLLYATLSLWRLRE